MPPAGAHQKQAIHIKNTVRDHWTFPFPPSLPELGEPIGQHQVLKMADRHSLATTAPGLQSTYMPRDQT